jgi:hypothetical protein
MKLIVNHKKYDTETANLIGKWSGFAFMRPEAAQYEEALYQKSNGEYFLYGTGNECSRYGHYMANNSMLPGWDICPLSEKEAQEWAEMYLPVDTYERYFGVIEE